MINISWSPPTTPNGIITVYEIRYRESTSTGPYNITNTTNTEYSIVGLIPNTSYTIGVRAYTSAGPGEWIERDFTSHSAPNPVLHSTSISSGKLQFLHPLSSCTLPLYYIEMYTSPSPSYTSPFAFGLYGTFVLLAVSLIFNIILIIALCCKRSSVRNKESATDSRSVWIMT